MNMDGTLMQCIALRLTKQAQIKLKKQLRIFVVKETKQERR
jgi:hypothetical protein